MKAMIFCAGIGSRLKPWTLRHPKALVEIGGEAMLGRVINKLKGAGVDNIVVNVHHFASQIVEYLNTNDNFGINIKISDETSHLLDTGGGLLKASPMLTQDDDSVIVHNADILTDFPIQEMIDCHYSSGSSATLLVSQRSTSRYLLFDNNSLMRGWINKSTGAVRPPDISASLYKELAFGGVHIISAETIRCLSKQFAPETSFSIMDYYIENCATDSFAGYTPSKPYRWHDVGKPLSLEEARADFTSSTY